jgi:hypothetical protein
MESWCVSRKLAVIRELIRRNPADGHEAEAAGGLPSLWQKDLIEQVALELAITRNAADKLISLAWALGKRLPLTAAALDVGTLNLAKARMIADETAVLSDADAAKAEELAAASWAGKTWSQIRERVTRAVVEVDPDGAQKRREQAEREEARVSFWREHAGTAALAGYGLPTDEALQAHQNIQARALAYKRHGIKQPLDLLRVMAMLDILNGADARDRYPNAPDEADRDLAEEVGPDSDREDGDEPEPSPDDPGDPGPGGSGTGGEGGAGGGLAANLELTVPLATLLGLAERPGQAHGLGVLDPGLARRLAAQATRNPRSVFEIIVTDPRGQAIGYGKATRTRQPRAGKPPGPGHQTPGGIRDGTAMAAFTLTGTGPDDGYGTWRLDIGDLTLGVRLIPIPRRGCDHRYESKGYRPGETLRRLVQVRDGECTMPVCVRHPRGTDFEHAVPWPAGRTCCCNGGARCRRDHRLKQSKGWTVEQLSGGRHRWTTPAGLTYTSAPRQYPI